MMEMLTGYTRELLTELREGSLAADLPLGDVAFERLCSTLEAEGELETADRCDWRGNSGGEVLRIDGHGGDPREAEGVLSLLVCDLNETEEPTTLNAADAKKVFGHLINFVVASRRGAFRDIACSSRFRNSAQPR